MRILITFFVTILLARAEIVSGSKIVPGGSASPVGAITLDGNQSFGSENQTYATSAFPGIHTLASNTPAGYTVSYSVCVKCTLHLPASYVAGTSVKIAVPFNGYVDVAWLYTPQSGVLKGSRLLSDGSAFTGASLILDSTLIVPAGSSTFSSAVSAGAHTVASSIPSGYSVAYSVCMNCTLHSPASFAPGSSVTVQVLAGGFADIQFQYTAVGATPLLTVVSPALNQTVSGTLSLSVSGPGLSKTASVEYCIGTQRLARVAAQSVNPNFAFVWNSALAADGTSQIEVTARDYMDAIIFQDTRPITLNNYNNSATVSLPGAFSGSVPLTLSAYDKLHFPAYWQIFLDGEILPSTTGLLFSDQDGVHANTRSSTLNSTLYPNGRHELHFAFHSNDFPAGSSSTSLDFRGMVTQNVSIENGRALMEILPNYLFVYTPVSTGVQLTCARAYTNGDRDSCSAPSYLVNTATSSAGVQVSPSGLVIGFQEGYGDILVSDSGKTATVHVWIRNTPGLPHFQEAGKMGTAYIAGKSLYVIAPFQLSPDLLITNTQLLQDTKRAGINTLNRGMFLPNSILNQPFNTWKQNFDNSSYASSYNWSVANGFRILASGDDIARRPGWEGSWIANWPGASQAVQYAMQVLAQSGAGLSIDVIDESSLQWGTNPAPTGAIGSAHSFQSAACNGTQCTFAWPSLLDPFEYAFHDPISAGKTFVLSGGSALATPAGKAYTVGSVSGSNVPFTLTAALPNGSNFNSSNASSLDFLWFSSAASCAGNIICNPALRNSVLSNVASWLRSASATVPISWPPAGTAAPYIQGNWMKPGGVSDYASHYWDSNQQRRTYVFGMGSRESQNSLLTAFLARQPFININRPQLLEQTMAGIDYLKFSPAGSYLYSPPVDQLLHVGITARGVSSSMMTAAAAGTAGVKIYKYDTSFLDRYNNRGDGSEFEQDGAPSTGEIGNWQAMGYAGATLAKSLQELVLGQPVNSPYLGRNIITGARLGASGNLLFVVNGWDGARTLPVDGSAYRTGNSVMRYRVSDVSIKVEALGDVSADTLTLAAGETAIYLFPKTANISGVDTVTFQPDTTGTRTVLRTNYLYSQNTAAFGSPVDCSAGCSVKIDRKIGEAFYSYAVLDSSGAEQCRSAAMLLPAGTAVTLLVAAQTRGSICQ